MKKPKVKGGHAFMLSVELPDEVIEVREKWTRRNPTMLKAAEDTHLTLMFVGRNLAADIGEYMRAIANYVVPLLPRVVTLNGYYSMFGRKRDSLVASVNQTPAMSAARERLAVELTRGGISFDPSGFGFNPHVTIGKVVVPGTAQREPRPPVVTRTAAVKSLQVKVGSDSVTEFPL